MARLGMDVDTVSNDGNQMRDIGQSGIPNIVSAIEGIIASMHSTWWGADSDAFVNAWQSTYKPNLTNIGSEVANHGQLAISSAQAQQSTSAAGSV